MHHIKANGLMQVTGHPVRAKLPKIVVQMNDALVLIPPLEPAGWITVNELQFGYRMPLLFSLNRWAIVLSRQHPYMMVFAQLPYGMPTNARLGTFTWTASISGNQNVK
jgi:hypothetical protein